MKQTKRLILLAISAVLVLGVISPAVASADKEWFVNGEPIPEVGEERSAQEPYAAVLRVDPGATTVYSTECHFHGQGAVWDQGAVWEEEARPAAFIGEPESSPWVYGSPAENSICGNSGHLNGNCWGEPTMLPGYSEGLFFWSESESSQWKTSSYYPFELYTHMHQLEGGEPCTFNENQVIKVSDFEGQELTNPAVLWGTISGPAKGGGSYEAAVRLEIDFFEAELVDVP